MVEKKKFDKVAYDNAFISANYDRINYVVPKGEKERIKAAANAAGLSVNAFITEAVHEKMLAMGLGELTEQTE